jgi:hypothetical protein
MKNDDRLPVCSGSLREYLLSRSIPTAEIHSLILTAIIALYGGLQRNCSKTKRQTSIIFSARRMHRDSPLSSLFIEYLDDTITERTLKLKHFIDQCQKIFNTNTISPKIHSLVVLFCFYKIDQSSNYEQYIGSEVWQQAMRHMQVVLLYLREFFVVSPISKFKNNLTDIFEHFMNDDSRENILEFSQSVSHAYCRLLRTQTSCLFPEFYMTTENRFPFAIKMLKKIELSNVTHWNEDELIQLLPFICCVSPLYCHTLYIKEFEVEDLKLLKGGRHPFQLLQNKLLLPTITQNRMENFVLPFINLSRLERDCKQFFKAYKDNCFQSFTSNIRTGSYEEEKCAEELAMIDEQDRLIHAQTDLQLYAAVCCFARLTRSLYGGSEQHYNSRQISTSYGPQCR